MISRSFIAIGALTLLSAAAYAGSVPPKELYGKSIIVTWTEHRSQRQLGQANFRDIDDPLSQKIYISTKGQWFGRYASNLGGIEAKNEGVGTSGPNTSGGSYQVQFSGRTITVTGASSGGIARRGQRYILFIKPSMNA